MNNNFLVLDQVSKRFNLDAGLFASASRHVWAVNQVSLAIRHGESYGLVGESGSGKTTLARSIVQLVPHSQGTITWQPAADEADPVPRLIDSHDRATLRRFRSRVKYIFQDPSSSLDPRMDVLGILTAGVRYNPHLAALAAGGRAALRQAAATVLDAVGLREADLDRRPQEFSGGQRQRISLARALLADPRMLICDEVVSALDVSIQGQILNLLVDLKRRFKLTMLFIAHDLTVVSYMADRIGVLYGGSLMEEAPAAALVKQPRHPYTQALYQAIPRFGSGALITGLPGQAFIPTQEPQGCPFAGRCPLVQDQCRRIKPPLRELMPGHRVACHLV